MLLKASLLESTRQIESAKKYLSDSLPKKIPYAHAAFFKETAWRRHKAYRATKGSKKASHPGLSISKDGSKIAFGTTKIKHRNIKDPKNFILKTEDCSLLRQTTLFLMNYTLPLTEQDMDTDKTTWEQISESAKQRLEKALRQ